MCQKFVWNEDAKSFDFRNGQLELRADFGPGVCPPACRTTRGCPKGTPENKRSLNGANQRCYEHYKGCRATGHFPDDPVVRENAAIIRDVEDRFDRVKDAERSESISAAIVGVMTNG